MNLLRYVILMFLLCSFAKGQAIELYVSPGGDDTNPGTKERPLATLQGARDAIRRLRTEGTLHEGVTVIFREGIYYMGEPVVFDTQDAAPAGRPVVFKASPGERVEFRGGIFIKGFEQVNDSLWKTTIPEVARYGFRFEQLYVNDRRAVRARTPNEGSFFSVKSVSETVLQKGTGEGTLLAVQEIQGDHSVQRLLPPGLKGAVISFYHNWDVTRRPLSGYDPKATKFFTVGEGMKPWNKIDSNSRYYIENYKEALDAPGEWFLENDGTLYYKPRPEETISHSVFQAPVLRQFIVLRGHGSDGRYVENLSFRDFHFTVAGYTMPAGGDDPAQAAAPVEAVIMADDARNICIENCEVSHTGLNAIWFRKGCSADSVLHCYLHDLGAGGVKIGPLEVAKEGGDVSKFCVVDNNIIREGGMVFPCAVGVTIFHGSDNAITHNEIADFRYSGISVGWIWGYANSYAKRNRISYNHIHHLGWGELSDMGGIYTLGPSEGTVVSYNKIHHIYSRTYGGWGLYTDEGSTGITMTCNLVYSCKSSGFHQHYGKDNCIVNNIFAFNMLSQLQATRVEDHNSFLFAHNIIYFSSGTLISGNWSHIRMVSDSNCYWDQRRRTIKFDSLPFQSWQAEGKDKHSVIASPKFKDANHFDFRLKGESVAKRIGFQPFNYDLSGVYGGASWKQISQFDPASAERFDRIVTAQRNANASPE